MSIEFRRTSMNKITPIIVSFIVVCFCIFDLQVFAYEGNQKWDVQAAYGTETEFSIDTTQKSGNGEYAIKIKNLDYGISRVEKSFAVKPHTMYRATVMAKCTDFNQSTDSKYDFGKFGAVLTTAQKLPSGTSYTGSKWKKLTYCFNSGDAESYTLALYNAGNKGTVYFSDFRLEEITEGNMGEDISTFELDPLGTATRAECATMIMNLLEANK